MKTAAQWLEDPGVFGTCANALLVDHLGPEWIEWEPATVLMEIQSGYGIEPSRWLQDRLQASATVMTNDIFFTNLAAFISVCNALNFGTVSSKLLLPADLDDVLWGVTEAKMLLGGAFDQSRFSSDVREYVGKLLDNEGITRPPRMLAFAYMGKPNSGRGLTVLNTDPSIVQAHFDAWQEQLGALEQSNQKRLRDLLQQLAELPLRHGQTGWIKNHLAGQPG